uniref:THAP domain-containing protein 1 n=1 Tax=Sinocyclocheilus grahami TaxID=75366 RepID=A0A672LUC4_SINGR
MPLEQKGGHYCIAPGCKINFHKLPLKWRTVLIHWLAALKRKKPPMGAEARVCSEHFLEEDYIQEKTFESANLVIRRTNKLKPEAAPSVFNFSGYNACSTDRPTFCDNTRNSLENSNGALYWSTR